MTFSRALFVDVIIGLIAVNSVAGKKSRESTDIPANSFPPSESCEESCDLDKFPQWREETGYWIGDLTFYGSNGAPDENSRWNYPFDHYKGFVTGDIFGGSYRQRNVFLYPPQTQEKCGASSSVTGNGRCGINGNSKRFHADQSTAGDSCDGSIEGPYEGLDTKSTLVGDDNAILYQVYFQGAIFQSQLTTFSGKGRRTRSAQTFNTFGPTPEIPAWCSFYRERRVERDEFYASLNATLVEYGILDEDVCNRDSMGNLIDGVVGGINACEDHLEESFELGSS